MKAGPAKKKLYEAPEPRTRRRCGSAGLLCLTCGAVSFAHGSNYGQKGMGLIMLILIGAAPTAYALNRAVPDSAHARLPRLTIQGAQSLFTCRADDLPPTEAAKAPVDRGEASQESR